MKTLLGFAAALGLLPFVATAVLFTNDTAISPLDTTFDGQEIVVSNATLTVDGPHAFASLRVETGGVVTHSGAPNGSITLTNRYADEPQLLMSTNDVTLANSNVTAVVSVKDASGTITYTNDTDYVVTLAGGQGFVRRTETSAIPEGALVLITYDVPAGTTPAGLFLTVANDVEITGGGMIHVEGRGYTGVSSSGRGASAGSPASGGGGGNGGLGGVGATNSSGGAAISGSFQQPAALGGAGGAGGGGVGGAGGGLVNINCGGTFSLNGGISANGDYAINSRAGGGAGGSVWITATNFVGAGSISANGGAGEPTLGGGGGGGRISILCATNSFAGSLSACGGVGWQNGGAGTVFTKVGALNGLLIVDNANRSGTYTPVTSTDLLDVMVSGRGILTPTGTLTAVTFTVASNSAIRIANNSSITALGDFIVQMGGVVQADGAGIPSGPTGTSYGTAYNDNALRPCGGGGHAGAGGSGSRSNALGGVPVTTGNYNTPSTLGFAGATLSPLSFGGAGGGYVRLIVTGTLQVDGKISANGMNGSGTGGGGGAGGSVYLTAGTLAGAGQILANGGNGVAAAGGGGGGGRVAVYFKTNSFVGQINALGGGGANRGGAGTVYLQPANAQQLIIDNGGVPGSYTLLPSISTRLTLNVRGAAIASSSLQGGTYSFGSVTVGTNSWLRHSSLYSLSVSGDLTVESGGGIVADEMGYAQGQGPGYGRNYPDSPYYTYPCGGGGFGGYGGNGNVTNAAGGSAYIGSLNAPYGSGGGYFSSSSIGGAGGGSILLDVSGTLRVDGVISANGGNGSGSGGGGGAGGRIVIATQGWTGNGAITANGGNGAGANGGGGGGGRISITYGGNSSQPFGGSITAIGGGGANWGGAGSIYQKWSGQQYGQLLANNANRKGASTSFDVFNPSDVTISSGASVIISGSPNWRSILIRSNAALTALSSSTQRTLTVSSNVVVEAGGVFALDGSGYGAAAGTGLGYNQTKGGGGHGGFGGANSGSFGGAYDSIQSPSLAGSGGGNGSGSSFAPFGGAGGGALKLTVNGVLQVDGRLSANGLNGDPNSGGGAGGSLWLLPNQLKGTGVISANGGAGQGSGGGGGGGRISISWTSNSFTGPITAFGGVGSVNGGAGTIYLRPNNQQSFGTLMVNNGGIFGTNTPLDSVGVPIVNWNLTLVSGAIAHATSPLTGLSNLLVSTGGTLTCLATQSNLPLSVPGNVTIASGGAIAVDGKGFTRTNGPGAGASLANQGAGGGYGGIGGASASGATGGTNYGSSNTPVDRGSGGGTGANSFTGGSDGGGAIHLSVGGTLTLDGALTASGAAGVQDDSGGGAGGSIWVMAKALAGTGVFAADGGDGELYGGGGGGGGRVAIYALSTNAFTGTISALGGEGANAGQNGTLVFTTNMLPFEIASSSPAGLTTNTVGTVSFNFNQLVDVATVSPAAFALTMPLNYAGPLPTLSTSASGSTVKLTFTPALNVQGDYSVTIQPVITDVFSMPMSQAYTNTFTVAIPSIEGVVYDLNSNGIAGVAIQTPGYLPAISDANGFYSLGVPPGWSGNVTPSFETNMFVPGSPGYFNLTATITNENFLMVDTIAPAMTSSMVGTNLLLSWPRIPGVQYQALWSVNLKDWMLWSNLPAGTNEVIELEIPIGELPEAFFRVRGAN